MEFLILIFVVIYFLFVAGKSVSRTTKKIGKYTNPIRKKAIYRGVESNYPEKQTTRSDKKENHRSEYRAKTKAEVKEVIRGFSEVKVEHVIDGDTIIVVKNWKKLKIRLDSIDCPEDGQHWGDTARYGLIKLIGGRRVRIEEHGIDRYERTLATIYIRKGRDKSEWTNVNERMVTLGHAWVMRSFYDHLPQDRKDKLNRLERWARSKKVGLWKTSNPVPPWVWRRRG